ncbi:MAG: hypothetical protein WBQ23_06485 [Bacteroidota bacterium]
MDAEQISQLREAYQEFLLSDRAFFEFPVGDDPRMRNKVPFRVLFPGMHRAAYYVRHVIARIAQMIDYSPVKVLLYRSIGFRIGKGVYISPEVILDSQFPQFIDIGDYVVLGWGAKIFVHDYDGVVYRIGRVSIGAGSVIGGFSMIRSGAAISENSLVKVSSRIDSGGHHGIVSLEKLREEWKNREEK